MGAAKMKERGADPDLRSIRLCSWETYSAKYPHGVVISPSDLSLVKGLAADRSASTVLVGETGTGKEVLAKLLHSFRREQEGKVPFVAVNCATISENLCESLLFGHRRGAFTGADSSTTGYIHEANGGILFLDEIHTLPMCVQQKFLRVLNDGTYNRLGETVELRSEFQLVAASTRDLDDEVEAGRFLIDLRSRLTGVEIKLHPLRARVKELPALVARRLSENNLSISDPIFEQLIDRLSTFHWRGNIRQLFKAIDTWILLSKMKSRPLSVEDFPEFKGMKSPTNVIPADVPTSELAEIVEAILEGRSMVETVEAVETHMISAAMRKHKTVTAAAVALGVPRSTLDAKRRKLGLHSGNDMDEFA